MGEDFSMPARTAGLDPETASLAVRGCVLEDILEQLPHNGVDVSTTGLPPLLTEEVRAAVQAYRQHQSSRVQTHNPEIEAELALHTDDLQDTYDQRYAGLNEGQKAFVDYALNAVRGEPNHSKAIFLDAPGGTGKTFACNCLLAGLRCQGKIPIATASSGVAALLLEGGRTFHSRFKVPIKQNPFNVSGNSQLAELLRECHLILWDEGPMQPRWLLDGLDDMLRDITGNEKDPFGGKVVVVCGDFRQVLPVVKRGGRAQITQEALKGAAVWKHFHTMTLSENMRARCTVNDEELRNRYKSWAEWLLQLGDGRLPPLPNMTTDDYVALPDHISMEPEISSLCDWVFPDIAENALDPEWVAERAILAPKVKDINNINAYVTDMFPGEQVDCCSADFIKADGFMDHTADIQVEYLNTLEEGTLPPHRLSMKTGVPLILLRSINKKGGLTNGTRLILKDVLAGGKVLLCRIATGTRIGEECLIPRIDLLPQEDNWPFTWRRRQFPVRVAFAMTINRAQGQTLQRCGVWLQSPVFGHGQLYVACSRVGLGDRVKVACPPVQLEDGRMVFATRNIVYTEVFNMISM
jgi:hypothetical protein